MDSSSTIEFTPSNSDDNSYRDKAPMDDTINIKVPVAVAAEWIAKGVGVLGTQANHDKNHLAHIDSSRVGMNNREVLEDRVTKLEKNPFVDNNSINHMATQIIEKVHGKTATLREKWNVEELKKVTFKAATKKLDEKLNEKANGNLITDIKRRYTEEEKRMLKTFPLGTFQYNVESPQEVLPSTLPASFYRIESLLDTNRDPMPAPVGRAKLEKVSQAPKHDRAINNTFVPRSMDLHSTGPAMAHPDKSAAEKQLEASLNIDRAVEAFRAHLEDAHITSLSDFDSAIEAFRTELLHDKPAEPMKIAVKELASCWVCGLTDHVTCACPKATCGDCGKVGHLGPFCPSLPCSGCDQEGHIVKDCPDAPECDNSLHHHNHQATKIDNSPEQAGGMRIQEVLKDCRGCWIGCDVCCPDLENDANQQASAPVDPRMANPICSCGRCDSCLGSLDAADHRICSPAPLPYHNGEMSFTDLFQDPQLMPVQDDLDNLPNSNKEDSDEHVEVKLPKWGAFGLHCLEQGITPGITDPEIATAPKSNDQASSYVRENDENTIYPPPHVRAESPLQGSGARGGDGGWGPAPQFQSVRLIGNAIPRSHFLHSHPSPYDSIPRKPAVRQPSIIDLRSDSSCSGFTRTSNEPLTVTYSAIVQAGGKTVNIPIDGKNVSGVEKEVINGNMKKVWNWVLEKDLGDKIDLQDAYELAKDMHGEVVKEVEESEQSVINTASICSLRENDIPEPDAWPKPPISPPLSKYDPAPSECWGPGSW
jgi:hypothetical protein